MVVLTIRGLELEFLEEGELFAWLGPSLRGCVGGVLKDEVCRQPPSERWRLWKHCAGCPHTAQCTYALLFDPDRPLNAQTLSGESGVTPPLVLAPELLVGDISSSRGGPVPSPLTGSRGISWARSRLFVFRPVGGEPSANDRYWAPMSFPSMASTAQRLRFPNA